MEKIALLFLLASTPALPQAHDLCRAIEQDDADAFALLIKQECKEYCRTSQNPTASERLMGAIAGTVFLPLAPLFWTAAGQEHPETPLSVAIWHQRYAMAHNLITHGAPVNAQDSFGYTPLHWASSAYFNENTYAQLVKLLLASGATESVHISDEHGMTPLHWAVYRKNSKIVAILLENGATSNTQDKEGKTALHYAYFVNAPHIIELLKKYGASEIIRDHRGKLPAESKIKIPNLTELSYGKHKKKKHT